MIDETFKGRRAAILVMIDSITGYIITIQWIKNREIGTIKKALLPFTDLFEKVKLVMTDGATYFPEVLNEIFPNATHQICLIHVMRNLYRKLEPYIQDYKNASIILKETRKQIENYTKSIDVKRVIIKKLIQKLYYWINKRDNLRKEFGIKAYQKKILQDYPDLKEINYKINVISASLRSVSRTLENKVEKRKKKKIQLIKDRQEYNLVWGEYIKLWRILHKFYDLFKLIGDKFRIKRERLISLLDQTGVSPYYKEISRVLKNTKNIDSINKDSCPIRLDRDFINTNYIESTNSRLRNLIDIIRTITDSDYVQFLFDLIKLRMNTTAPYSGLRSHNSPIERYGYNLRGRTYIDLIFDGLPPGVQNGIISSEKELIDTHPNMVGKIKIKAK